MAEKKIIGMGLLTKLLIGIFIPIVLVFIIIGSIVFFSWNLGPIQLTSIKEIGSQSLQELKTFFLMESRTSMGGFVEKRIQEKVQDVAAQIGIFVGSNPKARVEDLLRDPKFKEIAVQKIGEMGYTSIYTNQGVNYFHLNPQYMGLDFHQIYKGLPSVAKIFETGLKGPASDYYDWRDADGSVRSKYIHITPIKGTDLMMVADTYVEEFSKPVKAIEERVKQIEKKYSEAYNKTFQTFFLVILAGLIVLVVVIFFYSKSMVRPIHYLSEVADRISMGDLDAPISIKKKGEVGLLAESIERMQVSVKAAIIRLRKAKE